MKYGVVRNGQHLIVFPTRPQAERRIKKHKARDQELAKDGWITQEQADANQYHIEKVRNEKSW